MYDLFYSLVKYSNIYDFMNNNSILIMKPRVYPFLISVRDVNELPTQIYKLTPTNTILISIDQSNQ